jgi:hypothetical protein
MRYTKNKWYCFDPAKGSRQALPPPRKYVLVQRRSLYDSKPDPIGVGYRKDAAGDKQSPVFITPGLIGADAYRWIDCLPDDLTWP